MLQSSNSKSSFELNLTFIYFSSQLSELLVIDLIVFLILFYSSSYFFTISLLSLVGTSAKYLFPLISSKYPFILLLISHKGFTLLIFERSDL